ncbi:MATE efflux family protein [Bacteroides coprosuis DSM 18011]|uniref:Multidrug export protein MepA n=1 Tax=Bacteroides coprosuis DSM 18011 TaxID=679937 RepID=F3ZP28_9BACE|nr:MATE family efflux transporter [Bacteroides coprosuis]EGJ72601.1 MATE efflux family protein [Bacteroides coprosuis DSM 18011]
MEGNKATLALGNESMSKLMAQYAIPAIIAMTAAALYNMIDSIFIGHGVGVLAMTGLSITFPFMNLAAAFGAMVGLGSATLISVKLGQQDYKTAQEVLGNVVTLNFIIGISFSIISFIFLDPILYVFGASDASLPYARDFMEVILIGNIFSHSYFALNAVLRASGQPRKAMIATIFTVLINIVLAPIFIFYFGWGIRGAATATVTAQFIALLWQIHYFTDKKNLIYFKKGTYRLKKYIVRDILAIGMSPFLMNAAACFIVLFINHSLGKYGDDYYIGAYGIVNRIVFFFLMIVMGLNQGMQPIAGYNYGAKQYGRVTEILKLTIKWATLVTCIGFALGMFAPHLVVSIFTPDEELINIASKGLSITTVAFPVVGFQMVTSNFFQSIGLAKKAIFLSLTRQLLFLLPCLYFLPTFFGVEGVWASMPASDFIAALVAAILLWYQFRLFKRSENSEV